jgi:hypothetical protein
MRMVGIIVVVVAVISGIAIALVANRGKTPTAQNAGVDPNTLPGINKGPAPWAPEYGSLQERLNLVGVPFASTEQLAYHVHEHLVIYVNGNQVAVPASIGIESTGLAAMHTHDASGIIHVESPTKTTYSLGQFFDDWGVRFTKTCIGGYCDGGANRLRVYLDGKLYAGDPTLLPLTQHEEIAVTYGTAAQLPDPIPSTYSKSLSPTCAPSC